MHTSIAIGEPQIGNTFTLCHFNVNLVFTLFSQRFYILMELDFYIFLWGFLLLDSSGMQSPFQLRYCCPTLKAIFINYYITVDVFKGLECRHECCSHHILMSSVHNYMSTDQENGIYMCYIILIKTFQPIRACVRSHDVIYVCVL